MDRPWRHRVLRALCPDEQQCNHGQVQLQSNRATATIEEQGGRLASLVIDGTEIMLTSGPKPTRWGSFPMIPWCGRLPFARLDLDGKQYEFPPTSGSHANHGRSHLQLWSPVDENTMRTELNEHWPFGGQAEQRFELTDTSFTVTAEVRAAETPMPAMIGWHPWFQRQLDRGQPAEIEFEAEAIYATDDDAIPTGELVPVPPPPWDECFVGLKADPVVRWPGALELTISSTFDTWVIFTEPEHALCVEPQSGPPNQFHLDPHIVQPGEPLTGSMTFTWERL